jgi:hypothetical protein
VARVRELLAPLRGRSFRRYWVGQTTSAYGDQVFLVALALQVLRLGGGARELGMVNAAAGGSLVVFLSTAPPRRSSGRPRPPCCPTWSPATS